MTGRSRSTTRASFRCDRGSCEATGVDTGMARAADICGLAKVNNNHRSPTFPVGETMVTWWAIDLSGNTASCVRRVTVLGSVQVTLLPPLAGQPVVNEIRRGQIVPHKVTLANCSGGLLVRDVTVAPRLQGIDGSSDTVFEKIVEAAKGGALTVV